MAFDRSLIPCHFRLICGALFALLVTNSRELQPAQVMESQDEPCHGISR